MPRSDTNNSTTGRKVVTIAQPIEEIEINGGSMSFRKSTITYTGDKVKHEVRGRTLRLSCDASSSSSFFGGGNIISNGSMVVNAGGIFNTGVSIMSQGMSFLSGGSTVGQMHVPNMSYVLGHRGTMIIGGRVAYRTAGGGPTKNVGQLIVGGRQKTAQDVRRCWIAAGNTWTGSDDDDDADADAAGSGGGRRRGNRVHELVLEMKDCRHLARFKLKGEATIQQGTFKWCFQPIEATNDDDDDDNPNNNKTSPQTQTPSVPPKKHRLTFEASGASTFTLKDNTLYDVETTGGVKGAKVSVSLCGASKLRFAGDLATDSASTGLSELDIKCNGASKVQVEPRVPIGALNIVCNGASNVTIR